MAKVSFVRGTDAQIEQLELTEGQVVVSESGKMYVDSDTDRIPISPKEETITAVYDTTTATSAHAVGSYVYVNNHLYRVTVAIAIGDTITVGTNVVLANDLDTNTPVYVSGLPDSSGGLQAIDVGYDNTESGLNSENVQEAIDELVQGLDSSTVDYMIVDESMTQLEFAEMLYDEFDTNDDLMESFVIINNACSIPLKSSVSSSESALITLSDQHLVRVTRHISSNGNPLYFDVVAYDSGNRWVEKMKFQIVVSNDTVTDLLVIDYISDIDYTKLTVNSLKYGFDSKANINLKNIVNTTVNDTNNIVTKNLSDSNLKTFYQYDNNMFIDLKPEHTYTSTDGINWTSMTNNLVMSDESEYRCFIASITVSNTLTYVAAVYNYDYEYVKFYRSTDLSNWVNINTLPNADQTYIDDGYPLSAYYGDLVGLYVVNNKIYFYNSLKYSDNENNALCISTSDCSTWTIESIDYDYTSSSDNCFIENLRKENNSLITYTYDDSNSNEISVYQSTNGTNFTKKGTFTLDSSEDFIGLISYYNGVYYFSTNKSLRYSSDLITWTKMTCGYSSDFNFLGFSGNTMITTNGAIKFIYLSPDSNGVYPVSSLEETIVNTEGCGVVTLPSVQGYSSSWDNCNTIVKSIGDNISTDYIFYIGRTVVNNVLRLYHITPFVSEVDKAIDILGLTGASTANDVSYNNASSGLTADNVQDAIDELANAPAPITNIEAVYEETTALSAHSVDDYICMNNLLYRVTSAISIGDSIVVDTNVELVDDGVEGTEIYISNIPSSSGGGVEADDVGYDNTESGLTATTTQDAIDELSLGKVNGQGITLSVDSNGILNITY